jgi:hypothetical protein
VLNWNSNSFDLLSSTNAIGPYQPITPQPSSPYTVRFTDPHRFFKLRSK